MQIFMRPITALCTLLLLGLTAPVFAQKPSLSTADRQVCCSGKDATGKLIFFFAPASQCPKNQVVALERCKKPVSQPVCCLTHNGYFKTPSAERCKAAGGSIEPNRYCDKPRDPICCKTRSGYVKLIPNRCVTSGGKPVSMSYCKKLERKVCCKTPNGYYPWTLAMCKRAHGTVVNASYCKDQGQRVCCKTRNGYSWENSLKCRPPVGTKVDPRRCKNQPAERICCKFVGANGNVMHGFLSPKVCKAYKGTKVSNRYCLKATDRLRLKRN